MPRTKRTTSVKEEQEQATPAVEAERKPVELHPCLCGCGTQVARRFAQGHDQRLKGVLAKAFRADPATVVTVGGVEMTAEAGLKAMGWPTPAPLAPRKAKPKADKPEAVKRSRKPRAVKATDEGDAIGAAVDAAIAELAEPEAVSA